MIEEQYVECFKGDFYECVNKMNFKKNVNIQHENGFFENIMLNNLKKVDILIKSNESFSKLYEVYNNNKNSENSLYTLHRIIKKINSIDDIQSLFFWMLIMQVEIEMPNIFHLISTKSKFSNDIIPLLVLNEETLPTSNFNLTKYIEFINTINKLLSINITAFDVYNITSTFVIFNEMHEPKEYNINEIFEKYSNLIFIKNFIDIIGYKKDKIVISNLNFLYALNLKITNTYLKEWKNYFIFVFCENFSFCISSQLKNHNDSHIINTDSYYNINLTRFAAKYANIIYKDYIKKFIDTQLLNEISELYNNIFITLQTNIKNNTSISQPWKTFLLKKIKNIKIEFNYNNNKHIDIKLITDSLDIDDLLLFTMQLYLNKNKDPLSDLRTQKYLFKDIIDILEPNAFYLLNENKIIVPISLIVNDMIDVNNKILSYSKIGIILSHELIHSIDLAGIYHDEKGKKIFDNDTIIFINANQYIYNNAILKVIKNFNIDKTDTDAINELISDIEGIKLCIKALKNINITDFKEFFINHTLMWRKVNYIDTNDDDVDGVHLMPKSRINKIFYHIDDFYTTFGIEPTNIRYIAPSDRISLFIPQ